VTMPRNPFGPPPEGEMVDPTLLASLADPMMQDPTLAADPMMGADPMMAPPMPEDPLEPEGYIEEPDPLAYGMEASSDPYGQASPPAVGSAPDLPTFDWNDEDVRSVTLLLADELTAAIADKSDHDTDCEEKRRIYELQAPIRTGPWPGSANFQASLTREKIDGMTSMMADAMDVQPVAAVRPRTQAGVEVAKRLEEFIDLRLDEVDVRSLIVEAASESLQTGLVISKQSSEAAENAVGGRKEGLLIEPVRDEDFYTSPITIAKLEDAYLTAHRFYLPYWRLWELEELGEVRNCEKLKGINDPVKTASVENDKEGRNTSATAISDWSKQLELFECWFRWPEKPHQHGTLWRAWYHLSTRTLLKLEPTPFKHGRPPYALWRWWPRSKMLWGPSAIDLLRPMQEEMNIIVNQRLDQGTLASNPVILIEAGGEVDRQLTGKRWQPGMQLRVLSIDRPGIGQFKLEGSDPQSMEDLQLVRQMADTVLIPSFGLGKPLVDKDMTATEANIYQGANDTKGKTILHCLQQGALEMILQCVHLLYQYEVQGGALEFMGKDGEFYVADEDFFLSDVEIQINGRETQVAKAERQAQATLLLDRIAPLVMQDPATGVVLIQNPLIYAQARHLLEAYSIPNPKEFIGEAPPTAEEMAQMQPMVDALDAEAIAAEQGQVPPEGAVPPEGQMPPPEEMPL
jgi:hypothetical protein